MKARRSLVRLVNAGTLFTYLDPGLAADGPLPATSNSIEGGVNAQLRAMLRDHRGLSIERRAKAIFWWCYMHSPDPLPAAEILRAMPTDRSIARYTGGWASGRGWRAPSPGGATRSCGRSCIPRSPTGWTGTSRTHFLSYNPKPDAPTHNKSLPRIAGQAFYSRLFCLIVDAATRIPERKCPRRSICF